MIVVKVLIIIRCQHGPKAHFFTNIMVNRLWISKNRGVITYIYIVKADSLYQGKGETKLQVLE